jgi:hypothetical protein
MNRQMLYQAASVPASSASANEAAAQAKPALPANTGTEASEEHNQAHVGER